MVTSKDVSVISERVRAVGPAGRSVSRRRLLGGGVAAGLLPWLAACTGTGSGGPGQQSDDARTVTWWDHFRPLTTLFESELFEPFEKERKATVEHRQLDPPELSQALQLARRSGGLPDVTSAAGLETSGAALVENGWFRAFDDLVDLSPVEDLLVDGVHRFDGKVYSFPLFTSSWHEGNSWLNTKLFEQADVDPGEPARTWDEYRAIARQLTNRTPDGVYALMLPMKESTYLSAKLSSFSMIAGAPGPDGMDWKTGEYVWDSEEVLQAMEFLVALKEDGVIHPGSTSMGPRDARARWVAGQGAMFMWGTWFIGGLMVEESQAVERGLDVWQIPAPGDKRFPIHVSPPGGTFWVSSDSNSPKLAAELMLGMADEKFMRSLAAAMDQAPIRPEVVEQADVHPAYQRNLDYYAEDVRIAPLPESRNLDVVKVVVEMQDIHPDPGEIAQAVLTDSMSDYRSALRKYNDKVSKERERAIEAVSGQGVKVSQDDWVFSDWDPSADYGQSG